MFRDTDDRLDTGSSIGVVIFLIVVFESDLDTQLGPTVHRANRRFFTSFLAC